MKTRQFFRYLSPLIAVAFLFSSADTRADNAIPAAELQKQIRQVIEKAGPAVVGLTPTSSGGAGSGVIVSEDGLILTAAHVINAGGGDEMMVWLTDGRQVTAKKLGSQTGRDAAMLQIVGGGKWPAAKVREGNPERGEWVVAMGHPGGFQPERTPPVRLGRVLQSPEEGSDRGFLASDCAVSGGDSGGPLFDLKGNVVGIHSSIGMSLEENRHVPISAFSDDWDRLVKGESWGGRMFAGGRPREGAVLGVQLAPATDAEGALVETVVENSPAAKAGIQDGDVIFKFSGTIIGDAVALVEAVSARKPGDKVKVSLRRGGEEKEIELELGDAAKLSSTDAQDYRVAFERIQGIPARAVTAVRPGLGVRIADGKEGAGAEVMEVVKGSVAESAGVQVGDVILGFAGREVENAEALVNAVREYEGENAPLRLRRGDKELRVEAKFVAEKEAASPPAAPERKEQPGRPLPEPQVQGFLFDGKEMREINPERLREMMRRGGLPGVPPGLIPGQARPQLGVEIEDGDKVIVAEVLPGTVAKAAGFQKGDEIIELGGKEISDFESLTAAVREVGRRWDTTAKVKRGGKTLELHIDAVAIPREAPRRFGFRMEDGKVVPMTPEEFEKLAPQLKRPDRPAAPKEEARRTGKAQIGLMIDGEDDGEGVLVGGVAEGSAAEKAGMKPGDRVLAFGGRALENFEQLAGAVGGKKPGDKVNLKVKRDGKELEIEVELGRAEESDSASAPGGDAPTPRQMSPEEMRKMMERMRNGEVKPEDFQRMFGGSRVDPSLRRANDETLKGFEPAASKAKGSMVALRKGSEQLAFGTVVSGNRIITKASQIAGKEGFEVVLPDGKTTTTGKVIREFERYDLALLELADSKDLKPVRFVDQGTSATVGTLVTSPDIYGNPAGFGVVSVAARSLSEEDKGFLGIQIGEASAAGVVVAQAFEGGAAQKAGLRSGDVISKAGGVKVTNPTELIRQVAGKKPGEVIVVNYSRAGKAAEVEVKLRSRAEMGDGEEQLSQTARMGTRLSEQRSGYPSALTHDMPVNPEECGSPLINLEGEVIGINIARAGRTNTYALPGEVVRALLAEPEAGEDPKEESKGGEAAFSALKSAREAVSMAKSSYEQLRKESETDPTLREAAATARRAMDAAQESLAGAEKAFREIEEK